MNPNESSCHGDSGMKEGDSLKLFFNLDIFFKYKFAMPDFTDFY